jgi:protein ImuA
MNRLGNTKNEVIERLQSQIISMQGIKKTAHNEAIDIGLGPIENAFPGRTFPIGAVHEFSSQCIENVASTNGFISGIIGRLMTKGGSCVWVCPKRTVYPPALKLFGINPDRIIFVETTSPKEILWTIEEALKCDAWASVVGEVSQLSFTDSRRLQLAVEQSNVTGFIHRINAKSENTVACVSRWKISRIGSNITRRMPGVGLPQWNVQLTKVRNGLPGSWNIGWTGERFQLIQQPAISVPSILKRKVG